MPNENDEVKIEDYEVILERLRFRMGESITKEMLSSNVTVEFLENHFTDSIIFNWRAAIAGQGLRTIQYPKDWWQSFKERWFPKRFKKWWPIEYKIIDIYALYPSIAMPDKFTGIHIQETSSKDYS